MAEITKVYKEPVPALRFIGKRYTDADRVDGMFGARWHDWFKNGWFDTVKKQYGGKLHELFTDGGADIGLMRMYGGVFEYYIGVFMPENTAVPEGFTHVDFPAATLGVCHVTGKGGEVYKNEAKCGSRLKEEGFEISNEWCFERYVWPRFTDKDENGNITLDICFYVK